MSAPEPRTIVPHGSAGAGRRYPMVVALLVALASVPMLAAVLAGSASLDTATRPRTPFVADAPRDPVVVPGPGRGSPPPKGQAHLETMPSPPGIDSEPVPPPPVPAQPVPAQPVPAQPVPAQPAGAPAAGGSSRSTEWSRGGSGTGSRSGSGAGTGSGVVPPAESDQRDDRPECAPVPEHTRRSRPDGKPSSSRPSSSSSRPGTAPGSSPASPGLRPGPADDADRDRGRSAGRRHPLHDRGVRHRLPRRVEIDVPSRPERHGRLLRRSEG